MTSKNELKERLRSGAGKKQAIAIAVVLALGAAAAVGLMTTGGKSGGEESHAHEEAKGHGDGEHHGEAKAGGEKGHDDAKGHGDGEHHEEAKKGSRGGELISKGNVTVEALLSEDQGTPRLKIWVSQAGKDVAPAQLQVTAQIKRPGGEEQKLTFAAQKDALVSAQPVEEPHVFDGVIQVVVGGQTQSFPFSPSEGVIALSAEQQKSSGIVVEATKAASLAASYQLPGEVKFNEDTTAHVVPRVAGVVESVPVALGQTVRKGQVLAIVNSTSISDQRADLQGAQKRLQLAKITYEREKSLYEAKISPQQDVQIAEQSMREAEIAVSNARQKLQAVGATLDSGALNRYELRAPFDGTIVEKHIALGEQVREDANVFTVADLRTVWAQINVPAKDLPLVRVGDNVVVRAAAFEQSAVGKVAYVGSLIGESTRTAQARVTLENPKTAWRPGLFVNVEMKRETFDAPVTVTSEAVQTMEEKPVVFVKTGSGFVAQPVKVGRTDGKRVEIVEGLKAGVPYIAVGSFVAKAEAGKSTASHAH